MIPRFTQDAADDLELVQQYLTAHTSAVIAEQVLDRIRRTVSILCRFDHIGHAGHVRGTLEMMVPRLPFIIVYRADTTHQELIILRVYHVAYDR